VRSGNSQITGITGFDISCYLCRSDHNDGFKRVLIMNVSLTPELEKFVEKEVDSGLYQTASEVVRAGLRLLKREEMLK
jgi:hypothetical protein